LREVDSRQPTSTCRFDPNLNRGRVGGWPRAVEGGAPCSMVQGVQNPVEEPGNGGSLGENTRSGGPGLGILV
ncbi:hypothetical protein U1Q18_052015, partial [Sarracenia purpurea var. burkii]